MESQERVSLWESPLAMFTLSTTQKQEILIKSNFSTSKPIRVRKMSQKLSRDNHILSRDLVRFGSSYWEWTTAKQTKFTWIDQEQAMCSHLLPFLVLINTSYIHRALNHKCVSLMDAQDQLCHPRALSFWDVIRNAVTKIEKKMVASHCLLEFV